MSIKVYRSIDAGAPQLSNASPGSLITILRACLVNGYGTRTSSGWTMPYSDLPNNLAVFTTVNGENLRINDNLDYRFAEGNGYASMSDVNTGLEKYPSDSDIAVDSHFRLWKRASSSLLFDNWTVIANDEWFYFINSENDSSPSLSSGFFFGKYECVDDTYIHAYILTGNEQVVGNVSTTTCPYGLYINQSDWYVRRNYRNSQASEKVKFHYDVVNFINPNPFSGKLEFEKLVLRTDSTPYIKYGSLPGMYKTLGNDNKNINAGELLTINGSEYITISQSSRSYVIKYDLITG